jgi:hypothetical protein
MLSTVSSAFAVVGGRGGARASKVGNAAEEEVVETDDDLERVHTPSPSVIDYLGSRRRWLSMSIQLKVVNGTRWS